MGRKPISRDGNNYCNDPRCGGLLIVGENWTAPRAAKRIYKCDEHFREYMRDYKNGYRKPPPPIAKPAPGYSVPYSYTPNSKLPPVAEHNVRALSKTRQETIAQVRRLLAEPTVVSSMKRPYYRIVKTIDLRQLD